MAQRDGSLQLCILCALVVSALFYSQSPLQAAQLSRELTEKIAGASPVELLPINIILVEQANAGVLSRSGEASDRRMRRIQSIETLRGLAARSQGEVLSLLEEAMKAGEAGGINSLWIINAISARATSRTIRRLSTLKAVDKITLNPKRSGLIIDESRNNTSPEILYPASRNRLMPSIAWGVTWIDADDVWSYGIQGEGALVAMMDTGIDYNHTDLVNRMWHNPGEIQNNGIDDDGNGYIDDYYGYDFGAGDSNPMDDDGHGTHTAGTVAGDGSAGTITGVAPEATLMACKVLVYGNGDEADVWEAIQYAVDNGADIASFSIGWIHTVHNPDRPSWRTVCENAMASGLVMIVAAGNEQNDYGPPDDVRTPGDVPGVITIGATQYKSDTITSFSSEGPVEWNYPYTDPPYDDYPYPPGLTKPDVCAPGENVNSTMLGGGYSGDSWSGTSMATPHVAGLSALLLDIDPSLSQEQVKVILESTALHGLGDRNYYGEGRVRSMDAAGAVFTGLGRIEGHILDADTGDPLEARIVNIGNNFEVRSDPEGAYGMPVIGNDTHTLEVSYYGYRTSQQSVYVAAGDTVVLDFSLSPSDPGILAGWVNDASSGGGIKDATVSILSTPLSPATTNSNGFYYFLNVPGGASYDVRASASGYNPYTEYDVFIGENDTTVLTFDLEPESGPCPFSFLMKQSGRESDLALFYKLRDEVFKGSTGGERYIRSFYRYSPEITRLLILNPDLLPRINESMRILTRAVRTLLVSPEGTDPPVFIGDSELYYLQDTIGSIADRADPEIRDFLNLVREEMMKYRGRTAAEVCDMLSR